MTTKPEKKCTEPTAPSVPYEDGLYEDLQVPEIAAEYLNAAFEDGEPKLVLAALKDILKANGDIKQIAEDANITRQAVYAMLSEDGNPTLRNFNAILSQVGVKMSFTSCEVPRHPSL